MSLKNRDRVSKGYIVDEMHRFNILLESREVFLHACFDNDGDPGVDYRMSNNFVKNMTLLDRIDDQKPIIVHQHSTGGEWTEGMMIFDAIATCTCPVVIIMHGIAASMGSIIPQAADLRINMPNCWWLIHDGTTDVQSDFSIRMAKAWANWEDITGKEMMNIYAGACANGAVYKEMSERQIKNHIAKKLEKKQDWWLSSGDAVSHGFADAIWGTENYESLEAIKSHVL
jgi:ATP-dependent protease ClpP protease subunit